MGTISRTLYFFTSAVLLALVVMFPHAAYAATKLQVSGWIPYWRTATGTQDALLHLNELNQIDPFGYIVQNDGTLYDAMNITQPSWSTLIAAAKAQKVRVIPTVMWSNGQAIDTILRNPTTRAAQENAIVAMVKQNNFDGVDIDYEGKLAQTKPYFSLFLKELYKKMGNKWVDCTIEARTPASSEFAIITPQDFQYANDYSAINKYCDQVNLMTYDQGTIDIKLNAVAAGPYIPVADPQWVKKVVLLAEQTISKKKLVIGVATYGYEFSVTSLTQGYRYDIQWAFNPRYALELAAQLGITPVRNGAGELSFSYVPSELPLQTSTATSSATSTTGEVPTTTTSYSPLAVAVIGQPFNIVWWSDAQAVKDKIALAQSLGIRGIAIFKIDGGEDPNLWNILPQK